MSRTTTETKRYMAFQNNRCVAYGALRDVALELIDVTSRSPDLVLLFEADTGKALDIDLRGEPEQVLARLPTDAPPVPEKRGRGRPKLGVVAKEVTLLPRHWEWLAEQRGGASAALRRLVDQARKASPGRSQRRRATDAAYRFMSGIGGDLAGFEDASRALFADQRQAFFDAIAGWPKDVRTHVARLAEQAFSVSDSAQ